MSSASAHPAFIVTVRLPEPLRRDGVDAIIVDTPVENLRELSREYQPIGGKGNG